MPFTHSQERESDVHPDAGFTLLEMLVALALFALISAMVYTALVMTGDGFRQVDEYRQHAEERGWIGRMLKQDATYLAVSADAGVLPVALRKDRRAGVSFDQLTITVREMDRPMLSQVRYHVDDEQGVLIREVMSPWTRRGGKGSVMWNMGAVKSFEVDFLDRLGQPMSGHGKMAELPAAIRVRVHDSIGEKVWYCPVSVDVPLTDKKAVG